MLLDIRPFVTLQNATGPLRIDSPALWDWLQVNRGRVFVSYIDPERLTGETRLDGDGESVPVVHHVSYGERDGGSPLDFAAPLNVRGDIWLWAGDQKFERYTTQHYPLGEARLVKIGPAGEITPYRRVVSDSEFWRDYVRASVVVGAMAVAAVAITGSAATAGAGAGAVSTAGTGATATGATVAVETATTGTVGASAGAATGGGLTWSQIQSAAVSTANAVRATGAAAAAISTALTDPAPVPSGPVVAQQPPQSSADTLAYAGALLALLMTL